MTKWEEGNEKEAQLHNFLGVEFSSFNGQVEKITSNE